MSAMRVLAKAWRVGGGLAIKLRPVIDKMAG